jgi:hypothetical protein
MRYFSNEQLFVVIFKTNPPEKQQCAPEKQQCAPEKQQCAPEKQQCAHIQQTDFHNTLEKPYMYIPC